METTSEVPTTTGQKITLEYYKAPFGKRLFAFFFDLILMSVVALGFFSLTRLILEKSPSYQSAFDTYVRISTDSGLYVYKETNDNLVTIDEYYNSETYEVRNDKEETALSAFYQKEEFFDQKDASSGLALYQAQKIGDKRIGADESLDYFVYDSSKVLVSNPSYSAEKMHAFYSTAINNAIQYLNNVDAYVSASKTLSLSVNFIIIPCSISLSFLIFEFLIPLLFFRRGWQTLGMKVFSLSLLNAQAISPSFKSFLARFLWMFFVELLLSSMTFGVPVIVSFSMFAFRKDGQSFHDYMSGTYMVDSSEQSIYLSKEERDKLLKKAEETEARTDLLFLEDHDKSKKS
jgi:uncharacterized RDD family membrane protein YckC